MGSLASNSVSAIVCDPPYGLEFMGHGWDRGVPGSDFWTRALRVAKPGAHLIAFGGTRTYHRLVCAIEDSGWEVRDCLMWLHGQGFPKSHNIGKSIDKAAGAEREVVGTRKTNVGMQGGNFANGGSVGEIDVTAPATDAARQWEGWGTALKPAVEPIVLARKPLEGTVAENVQKYGTGALNIDGCRIPMGDEYDPTGRWPANVMHDGSDEVVRLFPGNVKGGVWNRTAGARPFNNEGDPTGYETSGKDDSIGSAARFFYCAKVNKHERGEANRHPTVKPIALMEYLIRLVTPPKGLVLDPFAGSGSTLLAADRLGFASIGIEKEPHYYDLILSRVTGAAYEP